MVDPQKRKGVNRIISAVLLITIVPSIIFGYNLVQQENFNEAANRYIQNVSVLKSAYLLESNVDVNHRSIDLLYSGYGLRTKI